MKSHLPYLKNLFDISAMQAASKNLMETVSEVYESPWPGHDMLYVQGQNSEMLWADLAHKLSDQVGSLTPQFFKEVTSYQLFQRSQMGKKITDSFL